MFKLVSLLSAKEQRQEAGRDHRPALELIQGGPHPDTGEVSETTTSLLLIADVLAELGGFGDVRERLGSRPLTELAANDAPRRLHVS